MEENVIEVKQLSKRFQTTVALQGCDFAVRKGEIFGFLGPSGSGKTTTIKLLTGQLKSDGGEIQILKESPFSSKIKRMMEKLNERQRDIVYLFYFEQWRQQDIAEYFGVSQKNVSDMIRRVLKILSEYVHQERNN